MNKKAISLLLLSVVTAYALQDFNAGAGATGTNAPMNDNAMDLKVIQAAYDSSKPNENVKVLTYNPGEISKIRTRVNMPTKFVLPRGEKIASHSLGDTYVFEMQPLDGGKYDLSNVFTLEAKYAGADTSLTIDGSSGRKYSFYIRSDSYKSEFISDFIVYMTLDGKIPRAIPLTVKEMKGEVIGLDGTNNSISDAKSALRDINWANAHYGYKAVGGNDDLTPTMVFDDGVFTYFQFTNEGAKKFPLVYKVVDGYDVPVNNKIEENFIIVESTGKAWTLRAGDEHLCVRYKGKEAAKEQIKKPGILRNML